MLRLILEMIPFGQKDKKRKLGTITIGNIKGNPDVADYQVRGRLWGAREDKQSIIRGFHRSRGCWDLAKLAIGRMRWKGNDK